MRSAPSILLALSIFLITSCATTKVDPSDDSNLVESGIAKPLSAEGIDEIELTDRLAKAGISLETLKDQVRAEIAWQRTNSELQKKSAD